MDAGDILKASGGDEEDDGDWHNEGNSYAWSWYSCASCREGEGWLEQLRAEVGFGLGRSRRLAVRLNERRVSEGAPDQGEYAETKSGWRPYLLSSESSKDGGSTGGLRRAN
jgi:hypothetical protein